MISSEFRAMVAQLESAAARTGEALQQAEHSRRLAIRSAILTNDHGAADESELVVAACRRAHEAATQRLTEARELLREAVEAERLAALDQLRASVQSRCADLEKFAAEAEAKLAEAVAALNRARSLENEMLVDVQRLRPVEAPLGRQLGYALSDVGTALKAAFSQGAPPEIAGLVITRADHATRALRRSVGA